MRLVSSCLRGTSLQPWLATLVGFGLLHSAAGALAAAPESAAAEWDAVAKTLGRAGSVAGDVYKVTFPRADLRVQIDGVTLRAPLALTSWMAFRSLGNGAVVTGDLVLTQDEVNPVVRALRDHGLQITAIHNHMLGDHPQVIFLHFWGRATPEQLARGLRAALDQLETADASGAPALEAR